MKKILIFHTAFIGDVVLATPMVKKIKNEYPDSEIVFVTTPAGKAVLKNNPHLKEIIAFDKRGENKGISGAFKLALKLRTYKFDIAFVPHRYLRTSLIVWLANISVRIGFSNSEGNFLLTNKFQHNKKLHEVDKLLSLVVKDLNFEDKSVELFPGEREVRKVDEIFRENNLESKKIIVVAAGSKWKTKMWPTENFNKVIDKLSSNDNYRIILIGAKDELKLGIKETDKTVNLINKTSLLELAEVIKRSDIVLTNDSSPIHIASAFEKPYIMAIFGATVKELGFYPWSRNSEVIENAGLYCRPCGLHGGDKCPEGHFRCMMEIKAECVYDKINAKLNNLS